MNPVFAVSFMGRHEDEKEAHDTSFKAIRRPLIILVVAAMIGYMIDRGVGNFFVFILILWIFNHYILTPRILVPFQDRLLPALKNGSSPLDRLAVAWMETGCCHCVGIRFTDLRICTHRHRTTESTVLPER